MTARLLVNTRQRFLAALTLLLLLCGHGMWTLQRSHSFVWAAYHGNTGKVQAYLDAGIAPDIFCWAGGLRALDMAVSRGHADVANLLLSRGAAPSRALSSAITGKQPGMVALLIAHGADVSRPETLQHARQVGDKRIIQLLLDARARKL